LNWEKIIFEESRILFFPSFEKLSGTEDNGHLVLDTAHNNWEKNLIVTQEFSSSSY